MSVSNICSDVVPPTKEDWSPSIDDSTFSEEKSAADCISGVEIATSVTKVKQALNKRLIFIFTIFFSDQCLTSI